jgi:mono/diheme cytochrome c family protein
MGRSALWGFIAAAAVVPSATLAQEVGQPGQGALLAKQVCAECHAVTKGAVASPNPSAPAFETLASTPGITSTALFAALQTSHRTMPNLVFKGDDMVNVIAYILSLKSGS